MQSETTADAETPLRLAIVVGPEFARNHPAVLSVFPTRNVTALVGIINPEIAKLGPAWGGAR